jgi:transcriptional regulator with XRE-family HTH domain
MLKEFGQWLTRTREAAGFESQTELAKVCGVHHSTLARLERGEVQPTPATLKKLAPHLKVPYKTLLEAAGHLYGGDKDNEVIVPELSENVLAELEKELSELQDRMDKISSILVKCRKNS